MTYGEYLWLSGTSDGVAENTPYKINQMTIKHYRIPRKVWDRYLVKRKEQDE